MNASCVRCAVQSLAPPAIVVLLCACGTEGSNLGVPDGSAGAGGRDGSDVTSGAGGASHSQQPPDKSTQPSPASGAGGGSSCPPCSPPTPYCDESAGRCVECTASDHCAEPRPACNTASGSCDSRFVGTWRYVSGTETFSCPGSEPEVETATGTLTIDEGEDGRLEVDRSLVVDSRSCVLEFQVVGETATLIPRHCSEVIPPTDLARIMDFSTWVMATTDGQTMTVTETHTIEVSSEPLTCISAVDGTLERVWSDAGSGGASGAGGSAATTGGSAATTGGSAAATAGAGGEPSTSVQVEDLGEPCEFPADMCEEEGAVWCASASDSCDGGFCNGKPGSAHCSRPCTSDADCEGGLFPMRCTVGCSFPSMCWDETLYESVIEAC